MTLPVAVFASGTGSNFQVLADTATSLWKVALLISDRENAPVMERARERGIEVQHIPVTHRDPDEVAQEMLTALEGAEVQMVLLAGYLRLVPPQVVARYRGRMLNLHPALLPAFGGKGMYGRAVHEAVLAVGARVSGVTVHMVDELYDQGRILAQWPVPVLPGDTAQTLAARIHQVEHRLFPPAVDALARALQQRTEPRTLPGMEGHFHLAKGPPDPAPAAAGEYPSEDPFDPHPIEHS